PVSHRLPRKDSARRAHITLRVSEYEPKQIFRSSHHKCTSFRPATAARAACPCPSSRRRSLTCSNACGNGADTPSPSQESLPEDTPLPNPANGPIPRPHSRLRLCQLKHSAGPALRGLRRTGQRPSSHRRVHPRRKIRFGRRTMGGRGGGAGSPCCARRLALIDGALGYCDFILAARDEFPVILYLHDPPVLCE
ncbi:unnamed protein product, partial [Mycena citricolor]